jgi:RIO kinase 1
MLKHHVIHGDLSAYNVLYWNGQIKIIDLPQIVDPRTNPNARGIFYRDVERVCDYFARYGIQSHPRGLARELWEGYQRKNQPERGMVDELVLETNE